MHFARSTFCPFEIIYILWFLNLHFLPFCFFLLQPPLQYHPPTTSSWRPWTMSGTRWPCSSWTVTRIRWSFLSYGSREWRSSSGCLRPTSFPSTWIWTTKTTPPFFSRMSSCLNLWRPEWGIYSSITAGWWLFNITVLQPFCLC